MSRRTDMPQPRRAQRFGAIVALLGLIFASTVASVSHSSSMPAMGGPVAMAPEQVSPKSHHGSVATTRHEAARTGHDMGLDAHDCENDATAADSQQSPQSPCEHGCLQCKDCAMTSFTLMSPAGIDAVQRHRDYRSAAALVMASIAPPSPSEPPRV